MFTKGEPLVYNHETTIEDWKGMKPSLCWVDKGIPEIRGEIRNYFLSGCNIITVKPVLTATSE
jgi:hypothetical protein